jgi:FlaG/FlaF family flagellin (archaellin)
MESSRLHADERSVSPVIGVVLIVAIAVVTMAVVGVIAFGFGVDPNPNAEVDFSQSRSPSGDREITITYTDAARAECVGVIEAGGATAASGDWTDVSGCDSGATGVGSVPVLELESLGDAGTLTDVDSDEEILVVVHFEGRNVVIEDFDVPP